MLPVMEGDNATLKQRDPKVIGGRGDGQRL